VIDAQPVQSAASNTEIIIRILTPTTQLSVDDNSATTRGGNAIDRWSAARELSGIGGTRFVRFSASEGRRIDEPGNVATGSQDAEVSGLIVMVVTLCANAVPATAKA
jgi:hypothetical protein